MLDNSPCLEITQGLLTEFQRWLAEEQRTGEKTRRDYMRYLSRLDGIALCSKQDVSRAFKRMGLNKTSYESFSRLLTYVERKLEGLDDLASRLRKAMPRKPRSREDTYVPPDEKVRDLCSCISEKGSPYSLFCGILLYSGCRGTEARYILENSGSLRTVELPYGVVRVHLPPELQRGSKREYVVYLPKELWREVRSWKGELPHQDTLEDALRNCGLAVKYLRKWWRQKAKEIGIDSETIEAFQGRPRTVGGRHYTDWIPILDKEYEKIVNYIRECL